MNARGSRSTRWAVLLAAFAFAPEVHAAPDVPLRYTTDGDPSCPPEEHVRAEIVLRLSGGAPMPERVSVDIRREGGKHVATLTIQRAGKPADVHRTGVPSAPCACLAVAQYACRRAGR